MMNNGLHISDLLLERYLVGDMESAEKQALDTAIHHDRNLVETTEQLRRSDAEIRGRYPAKLLVPGILETANRKRSGRRGLPARKGRIVGFAALGAGIAAAVILAAFPVSAGRGPLTDRAKGTGELSVSPMPSAELRIYLKEGSASRRVADSSNFSSANVSSTNFSSENLLLSDQTLVSAGSTVQLVYTVKRRPQAAAERYGVIFSIDGRGAVSLHYPYTREGTTRLVEGKQTPLEEAYTLDDAPDYEIFFFVVADTPLDAGAVLRTAESLAQDSLPVLERSVAAFKPYEVKSLTLRKE
ncbi:hypothetical protein FACS1894124_0480 [Spirochaetia bacterium]|nr:hypothetical protein FACS1894124_0480 [Spirochaetia bacterium]